MDVEEVKFSPPETSKRPRKMAKTQRATSEVSNGNRITESHFCTQTRKFAIATKYAMRTSIAVDNPFPHLTLKSHEMRGDYVWKIVQAVSKENEAFTKAFQIISANSEKVDQLTAFVSTPELS